MYGMIHTIVNNVNDVIMSYKSEFHMERWLVCVPESFCLFQRNLFPFKVLSVGYAMCHDFKQQ